MNNTSTQEVNKTAEKHGRVAWLKRWAASIREAFLNRANIGLLAAGILYGVFRPFFEQLFSRYWVTPFLSCFQSGVLTQVVAWAVMVGIVVKCGIACRNRKRISETSLYRWILITAIWAAIRFSDAWSFVPWVGSVTYFDIVPFYALSVGVAYGCQFIKRKPAAAIEEEGFECDEPIETSGEDRLGRSGFARTLARRLLKTRSSHQSFAVGILSPWGYGKTSFLNLIKDELKHHEAICIDFSPWSYGKETDLIREFFTEVGKALRRYADTLPRDMMEYARILEKSESTSWLSMLLSLGNTAYSLEQQGNLLKQSLQKIDRPIVVFIDDLDRLGGNEIMEVLKLIRNVANFPGLKFVAAYDRAYLVEVIKKQNVESANCYLEKIFQIEYTLPAFEREKLIEYLKEECGKFLRDEDKEALKKIFDSKVSFEGIATEELITLRDVKRYINSLRNSYEKLAGNVVLRDLMNLEILRLKYKPVYDLLSRRWEQVVRYKDGTLKLYKTEKNKKEDALDYLNMPSYEVTTLLNALGYTEIEMGRIIRILKLLFSPIRTSTVHGAINNKDSIARYFYNNLSDKDIPIEVFDRLWEKEYDDIKAEVDEMIEKNQAISLVNQLSGFKPESVVVCAKVVRIMFYVGTKSTQTGSLYRDVLEKIDLLSYYPDSDVNVKLFLLGIIAENRLSNYVSDFLFSEYRALEKYFSFEVINNQETGYLQEAVQQDLPLVKVYDYMYRATHKGHDYEVNERANDLFKSYANRHIEEFLQSLVSRMMSGEDYYYVGPFAKEVWGSWGNFREYVNSISLQTPIIDEFKNFFNGYFSTDFNPEIPIAYKFRHIKIERE